MPRTKKEKPLSFLLGILCLAQSCNHSRTQPNENDPGQTSHHPSVAKPVALYDSLTSLIIENARWNMFCFDCDSSISYLPGAKEKYGLPASLTFGELELELQRLDSSRNKEYLYNKKKVKNLVDVHFQYSYKNIPFHYFHNTAIYNPCLSYMYWRQRPDTPMFASDDLISPIGNFDTTNRYGRMLMKYSRVTAPVQPEVIKYIRTHASTISPTMLAEAHRHHIFDSVMYPPAAIDSGIIAHRKIPSWIFTGP